MVKQTIPQLKKKLDKVFSKYIRLRDALITTGTKTHAICISCGKRKDQKYEMDAGHYVGRGAGATRYDERNVHAQCKQCNGFGPTAHQDYHKAIIKMYGEDVVEELIILGKQTYKFDRDWLKEQVKYYKEEYKEMYENN